MVSEFEFIANIKSRHSLDKIGDDCAVLRKDAETDLLLTADMLVEDVDFRLDWTSPEFLGHKALAVSLSDIAAMGGVPKWTMLSIGMPEHIWKTGFSDGFYSGLMVLAGKHNVEVIGGDISKTPDRIVINSVVGGEVAKGKAILRSGARPGHAIFVTGTIGGAAGGLKMLENGIRLDCSNTDSVSKLLLCQLKPEPQTRTAKLLYKRNIATAMIDISDGLLQDLAHVCKASGVGARIDTDNLPIETSLAKHFPADDILDMALKGGEDFELVFTSDARTVSGDNFGKITRIGEITANAGLIETTRGGISEVLQPRGYRHF